jgi:hypothetical protein
MDSTESGETAAVDLSRDRTQVLAGCGIVVVGGAFFTLLGFWSLGAAVAGIGMGILAIALFLGLWYAWISPRVLLGADGLRIQHRNTVALLPATAIQAVGVLGEGADQRIAVWFDPVGVNDPDARLFKRYTFDLTDVRSALLRLPRLNALPAGKADEVRRFVETTRISEWRTAQP